MTAEPEHTGTIRSRNAKGQFVKGVSGNPAGRPAGSTRADFNRWSETRLAGWLDKLDRMGDEDARVLMFLIEQAIGKARQQQEISGPDGGPVETVFIGVPRPK